MNACQASVLVLCIAGATACGSSSSPTSPSTATLPGAPKLTAPSPETPADAAQLTTLRPTLIVKNATSDQSAARTYEFQISDRSDFSTSSASRFAPYAVVAQKTGVPEGSAGTTSFTPDYDLQPTTRFYWRTRVLQGSTASDWSATRSFNSAIGGYNIAGALYDPLVNGSTVGTIVGSTTFTANGLRINDSNSYVRYQLPQTIAAGEFSVEIQGLYPGGPGGKLKLFSMMDGAGDLYRSQYLANVQYRGLGGNPDNCIAFKALFGDPGYKLEPDAGTRAAGTLFADPGTVYFWKATWNTEFRVQVYSGGIGGTSIYNVGIVSADVVGNPGGTYNPNPHFAYLGANNGPFGEEDGSWPGAVYRNLWVGNGPRPRSLGSALLPQ